MARIAGINIPPHQHADIGLTAIYGIGRARSREILDAAAVPYTKKVKELNDAELERIREGVAKLIVEGDLRREIQLSIKRLIDLGPTAGADRRPAGPRSPHQRRARAGSAAGVSLKNQLWRRVRPQQVAAAVARKKIKKSSDGIARMHVQQRSSRSDRQATRCRGELQRRARAAQVHAVRAQVAGNRRTRGASTDQEPRCDHRPRPRPRIVGAR
jgi:small subunit ribosomal protein S13